MTSPHDDLHRRHKKQTIDEDEDLLEYEERKDLVNDLQSHSALMKRKSLLQLRQRKSASALSLKQSATKKFESEPAKSMLSKKDYEEIRTMVRD